MSIGRRIAWSFGSTGVLMSMYAFTTFISFFYIDHLGMDPMLFGLGMFVFTIWNAVNDPLVGHLSDNTRSRLGRRIPYVLFGAIPMAAAFALVWMPPRLATAYGDIGLFVYFLISICLFDTLYTLVALNYTALFPEMFSAGKERAYMVMIRQIFGVVGLAIGVALPPIIYGPDGGTRGGWITLGLLLAAVTAISVLVSVLGSKERRESLDYPKLNIFKSFTSAFGNRSFLTFAIACVAVNFALSMLTGVFPFYAKYILHIEGIQQTILMAAPFITTLIFMPLWAHLYTKHGARSVLTSASVAFAIATIPFVTASTFTHGLITNLLVGVGLAGLVPIFDLAIADVVDEDEIKTGLRREGTYFGLNGLFVRIAAAIQAISMAGIMKATGFKSSSAVQTSEALQGLRILITPATIGALFIAVLMLWAYPLHGGRLAEVHAEQAALRQRRTAGAAQISAK